MKKRIVHKAQYKEPYPTLKPEGVPDIQLLKGNKSKPDIVEVSSTGIVEIDGKCFYFEQWIIYKEIIS